MNTGRGFEIYHESDIPSNTSSGIIDKDRYDKYS